MSRSRLLTLTLVIAATVTSGCSTPAADTGGARPSSSASTTRASSCAEGTRATTSWLAHQPVADPGRPGVGASSVDVLMAMRAAGVTGPLTDRLRDAVVASVPRSVPLHPTSAATPTSSRSSAPAGHRAGLAAKMVLALDGLSDIHDVGGVDLPRVVSSSVRPSGMVSGGPADVPGTFPQALAVLSMARTHTLTSRSGRRAVDFLLRQQCRPGYFHYLRSDTSDCDREHGRADTDSTALATMALDAAAAEGMTSVTAARDRAVSWLSTQQGSDGGFATASLGGEPNANTTGLSGAALAPHRSEAARRAAQWVTRSTLTSGPDAGAVRYQPSMATDIPDGNAIAEPYRQTTLLATVQAVMALAPTNPAAYGRSGSCKVS